MADVDVATSERSASLVTHVNFDGLEIDSILDKLFTIPTKHKIRSRWNNVIYDYLVSQLGTIYVFSEKIRFI